jgi:hypothetical protein
MVDDPLERQGAGTPAPQAGRYPLGVEGPELRRRWDYADGIAREVFGDVGEAAVFMAAVVLYESNTPTD